MKAIADAPALAKAMPLKDVIWAQFERVAQEQEKKLAPLSDDLILADSDLDSLCLAIIVARLEDALGFDPFSLAEDAVFPMTLRDFVSFYETYANGAA
jgi:acyl carrier protein